MTFNLSQEMWRRTRLGDIVRINNKSIDRTFTAKEIEYHDTSSVYKNIFSEPQVIKLKDAPSRARRLVQDGDVIISTVRPNQEHIGLIEKPKENTVVSTGFAVITPISIDSKFLFYYLSQPRIVTYLTAIAETSTSTFPAIRPEILEDLLVTIPAQIEEQKRIGDILYLYDQKIDLNRQTNATLEAIAQAIFKEWFVDFNYPGATGEMVNTPLGPIPKSWRVGVLGDLCNVIKGTSYMSSELAPSRTALVTLKSINRGGGFNNNGFKEYVGKYKPDQTLDEGDLVLAQTDMTQKAEVVGSPAIVENPFEYETLVTSLDLAKCEPINEMPSSNTLYHFLERQEFKDYCLSQTNGSTVLHLRTSEIPNYEMVIPREKLLQEFDHLITPIRQSILENNKQNRTLMVIRDKLIPYLMSGEFEI